jgi:hypothetical protein
MPKIGTCFQLIPEGEDHHFWIVISKVVNGRVLVANITDSAKCFDSPCHFEVGEHATILKPSAVYYKKARTFNAKSVDERLAEGQFVRQLPDYPIELVDKIIAGARKADDLTLKLLKYLD